MGTSLFGEGDGHWARLHYQTEISSREAFHDRAVAGVDWQETTRSASPERCRRQWQASGTK